LQQPPTGTLSLHQQEQFIDTFYRFRRRGRIVQVAESDLYYARKRIRFPLLAGQGPYACSALK
jgi:hypothetical protein